MNHAPRIALFALPGPGDAVMERIEPAILVRAAAGDFPACSLPHLDGSDPDLAGKLKAARIDLILIAGWEFHIAPEVADAAPLGAWNIHPSLLPRYRGHNPYFHVIANGETETGVTIHRLSPRFDQGDILLSRTLNLPDRCTLGMLWRISARLGAELAEEAIERIAAPDFDPATALTVQPDGDFPRAPKVTVRDITLSSEMTVAEAERRVRACNPFYGAGANLHGRAVKVYEAEISGPVTSLRHDAIGVVPSMNFRDGILLFTVFDLEGYGLISASDYTSLTPEIRGAVP